MKHCKACGVDVLSPGAQCPLCAAPLEGAGENVRAAYPPFVQRRVPWRMARRVLLFFSLLACMVCALVNLLTTPSFWWWLFVATGIGYLWLAVPHLFRKGGNAGGKLLMQVVCIALLQTALDAEIGWQGWSVTYALPATCCAGIVGVLVFILCNPHKLGALCAVPGGAGRVGLCAAGAVRRGRGPAISSWRSSPRASRPSACW